MSYNSKYTGEQVEGFLDQIANGEIGGGIEAETDPVFSASPAASITEEKKAEWDNKVDKVSGKQLSTEDFTTILKNKLEGLSNYDDTELSEALSTLRGDFDKLVSGDTTTAIKTFNEIIAFLDGIQDTQDLSSIIASIEQQIAAKQSKITDLDTIRDGALKGATALQSIPEEYVTEDNLIWTKVEGEAGVRLKGTNGTATGNLAISAGDDKKASDGTQFVSAASGDHSVAFGYGNTCAGRTTLAQGLYNTVDGKDSVAFGQRNLVGGDQAFAAGQQNEVTTRLGVAIGYKNKATNTDSIAIGYQNTSGGSASVAMGDTCEANGTSSTAMGYKTKATGSYSSTFGQNTQATNSGEVAMGSYNKSTTSTDTSEQTAFSFGIGTSDTNRVNALEIKKNGDVYIGDKLLSVENFMTAEDLAAVATSGSYNDLSDKPTIPSAINIAGTNYTPSGTGIIDLNPASLYRKPSDGIPKNDLSSEVQTALTNADTYKGTVTGVKINGTTKSPSNGIVDLGNIPTSIPTEVYVADFTMEQLRQGMYNGTQVDCSIQDLITAMEADKVILVRESEDSAYRGVHVLNGYIEDLLYFSIVDIMGDVLWCEGTAYGAQVSYINGASLHLRSWDEKQDALVSGTNIKTINGESIVGSGDITISGGGSGTITEVKANGTSIATSGVANIPAASTSAYGVTKLSSSTSSTSTTLAATASAVKSAYDLANSYKGTVTAVKINGATKSPSSGTVDVGNVVTSIKVNGSTYSPSSGTIDLGTINGGGSSSSSSAKEVVVVEATYYSYGTYAKFVNILPNKIYICEEVVDYVSITLNSDASNMIEDFTVMFKPLEYTSLSITGTTSWANAITPEFEANTMYELSLRKLVSQTDEDIILCCGASFELPLSGTDPA